MQTAARRLRKVVDRLQSAERLCPRNQRLILLIDKASKATQLLLRCTTLTSRVFRVAEEWEAPATNSARAPLRNINETPSSPLSELLFISCFILKADLAASITPLALWKNAVFQAFMYSFGPFDPRDHRRLQRDF